MQASSLSSSTMKDIQHLMLSDVDRTAHLSSDTRLIKTGDVFLAYPVGKEKGRSDNRIHIPMALSLGAGLVLYDTDDWPESENIAARALLGDTRCIPVARLATLASEIADWWYGNPSKELNMIGVTGTNGKTTVTHWLSQALGRASDTAIFGTLGYGELGKLRVTGFTTPDATRVQRVLAEMKQEGFKNVAMEVSSHALEQGRVGSVQFKTAIFTNLTQDHLDYHGDMDEYARAKFELFRTGSLKHAILNMDDATGARWIEELCHKSNLNIWCFGNEQSFHQLSPKAQLKVQSLIVKDLKTLPTGMTLNCQYAEHLYPIQLECLGEFNVYNVLAVLATLLANQIEMSKAVQLIQHLKPVDGRMEIINSQDAHHAMMVVDFAHTPDALEKALLALQPIAKARGGQLICVFGCGGNRDTTKRPLMGLIAAEHADHIIITSDNPRMENPEEIIQQIANGLPLDFVGKVDRIVDRAFAILTSVKQSDPRDVVLIAGKGHEKTQEIAGNQFIFSDQDHIRLAIRGIV